MARIYKENDRVGRYTILREITRGMMAISYVARDDAGQSVFFKQYKSPSVLVAWYKAYIRYQAELKTRIQTTPCKTFCYRFLDVFELRLFGAQHRQYPQAIRGVRQKQQHQPQQRRRQQHRP